MATNEPTKDDLNEIFGSSDEDWSDDKGWETEDGSSLSWDFKVNKRIAGVYTGNRMVTTKFGDRAIYTIETPNHTRVDVWETAMLKRAFEKTNVGQRVRIEYLGKEQTEKGQQVNTFKFQRETL